MNGYKRYGVFGAFLIIALLFFILIPAENSSTSDQTTSVSSTEEGNLPELSVDFSKLAFELKVKESPTRELSPEVKTVLDHFTPPIAAAGGEGENFVIHSGATSAVLHEKGVTITLPGKRPDLEKIGLAGELPDFKRWALHWSLVDARPVKPRAEGIQKAYINSMVGNDPSKWTSKQSTYEKIVYDDVISGMDMTVESRPQGLKYTLNYEAGSFSNKICLRYDGANALRIIKGGSELEIETGFEVLRESGLICYQPDENGLRVPVGATYTSVRQLNGELAWEYTISLNTDELDFSKPLVVDPIVDWAYDLGGSSNEY